MPGTTMTNDRITKLDELYDQACRTLVQPLDLEHPEESKYRADVSLGIIDRWLMVRESDRQFELQQFLHNVPIIEYPDTVTVTNSTNDIVNRSGGPVMDSNAAND